MSVWYCLGVKVGVIGGATGGGFSLQMGVFLIL